MVRLGLVRPFRARGIRSTPPSEVPHAASDGGDIDQIGRADHCAAESLHSHARPARRGHNELWMAVAAVAAWPAATEIWLSELSTMSPHA